MRGNRHWELLIQAEAQVMSQLGDKGNRYLWEQEWEQLHKYKEGISVVAGNMTW